MTCASGFHDDDQARALKAIAGIKNGPSRRQQQDATNHASYISGPEWEGIGLATSEVGKATPDLIYAQAILDILVCRMGVVNPSEHTLKAVTANALVLAHGSRIGLLTYEDKMALLTWIRKKLKAMVRVQKTRKETPIEYCEKFPPNPCDLEAIHPELYSKLKIPGCWTDSRVNTQLYSRTLCSFSCRRNVHEQQIVPAVQGFDMNKLMFGMMQKMLRQNADDDEDGIFTYNMPGRRKRSIDGLEQRLSLKRRRSSFGFGMDDEEEEHEEPPRVAGAQAVGKAASVGKAPPVGPGPRIEEVPEFGEAEEAEEPAVEEASGEAVEVSAVPALAIVKRTVAQVPVVAKAQEESPFGLPKAREPSADELLDAIIQRDAERAEAAKVAAAAKRAAAAAAKKEAAQLEKAEAAKAAEAAKEAAPADGEAKLPVKAGAKPPAVAKPSAVGKPPGLCGKPPGLFGKRPAVGKAVGKPPAIGKPPAVAKPSAVGVGMPPAVAKPQPPAVAKPPAVGKASAVGKAKPTWSHEGSRTQYLCRTGVKGPGQSHAIKYGDGIRTKERARLEAVRWVAEKEKS